MESSIIQTLIAAIGLGTQLVLLAKELFRFVKESEPQKTRDGETGPQQPKPSALKTRSLLDLSFIILCSAFFSLLTADSLMVSGRTPSGGPLNVFYVVLIAFAYTSIVFTAWFINITEKVIGFLSIITLVILITAPGGPFDTTRTEGESGLSVFLVLPVVILVTLASTMLIYSYGNPLKRSQGKLTRAVIASGLLISAVVAAIAVGKQIDHSIANDERSPQFENDGKQFAQKVTDLKREDKRNFYHFASEISLIGFYQDQYYQMRQQQEEQQSRSSVSVGDAADQLKPANSQPNPLRSAVNAPGPRISANTNTASTNSNIAPPPDRSNIDDENVRARIASLESSLKNAKDAYDEYQSPSRRQAIEDLQRQLTDLKRSTMVSPWIDFLVTKFENLPSREKIAFLRSRLYWIHPIGWDSRSESVIPIPALKVEDRLTRLAKYRLIYILYDQEKQRRRLLNSEDLSYPDEVRDFYPQTPPRYSDEQSGYTSADANRLSRKERVAEYNQRKLFPPKDFIKIDLPSSNTLTAQLSLPQLEESVIGYREYRIVANEQIRQKIKSEKIDAWLAAFEKLEHKSQQALYGCFVTMVKEHKVKASEVLSLLPSLNNSKADFSELIESKAPLKIQKLVQQLTAAPKTEELFQPLMNSLRQLSAEDKATLITLLSNSDGTEFSIDYLFRDDVLLVISDIKHDLNSDDQTEFVSAVVDPVWYSIKSLPIRDPDGGALVDDPIVEDLVSYRNLSAQNQDAVLKQLAISFYQPGGPYSFDPISLLVAQAHLLNDDLGWITAGSLCLPFIIGFMGLGTYFANLLNKRDRMREVLSNEGKESSDVKNTLGTPVELIGREKVLETLQNLAERGWSTIGIVGRRGIGKSRILQALISMTDKPAETISDVKQFSGIRLWVSSPSKFTEEEFIRSIYERLASSTESAIARFLRVKPLSARTIENKIAIASGWIYAGAVLLFGIVIYYMSTRLSRIDIVVIWIPIIVLLFSSVFLFVDYLTKLQPINLTSWLQRARDQNPQTYLLYRDVYGVLESLKRHSVENQNEDSMKGMLGLGRSIVLGFLCIIVAASAIWVAVALTGPGRNADIVFLFAVVFLSVALYVWFLYFRKTERTDEVNRATGSSLMSLIAEYRIFASSVVYRLQQGALNTKPDEKFIILVCIDELDKIVDFEEIRSFIRRVKAIFEVPGLYYYISIAEDTIRSLYLGPAAGKNEVDSAFDHIVRIAPLSLLDGEKIALNYLQKNIKEDALPKNIGKVIAVIAFGLPRDIIRRCDEFISNVKDDNSEVKSTMATADVAKKNRHRHLDLGYELQQLTSGEIRQMRDTTPLECSLAAKNAITSIPRINGDAGALNESKIRLLLLTWTLAMIESVFGAHNSEEAAKASDDLCKFGYRISDAPLADLVAEAEQIHTQIFERESPREGVAFVLDTG